MPDRSRVRILIIDNDRRVGQDLTQILESEGYCARVAEGSGDALLNQALRMALIFRPHVAIVDLRLLDEEREDEDSGLKLLSRLSSAFSILYSAYLTPSLAHKALEARAFGVVGKDESPQRLLAAVAAAAQKGCTGYRGLQVYWPSAWTSQRVRETLFGKNTDIPQDIVQDSLGRLFPEANVIRLETLEGAAESPPSSSISRGRSVVLKVSWGDRQPVVVKLGLAERIRKEEDRYRKYIDGFLTGQFNARLERCETFWDMGGIVYNFLGSSVRPLFSFNVFYHQTPESRAILTPLRHLFGEVWSQLYQRSQPYEPAITLFQAYDQLLDLEEHLRAFPNQEEQLAFPGFQVHLINPIAWVLRHKSDSMIPGSRQAITHGDLHGNNFFVDGLHAWAIDFERSGPGPLLRDFTELEVHIITRLTAFSETDLSLLYDSATLLTQLSKPEIPLRPTARLLQNAEIAKALGVVGGLRDLASDVTRYQDFREYLWGLLLDAVFVATLAPEKSPQRERALLFASVICGRLRNWNKEWPPSDWPPVECFSPASPTGPVEGAESEGLRALSYDAFLSYNRNDEGEVKVLAERLRHQAGLSVWLDRWNLLPGDPWQEEIENALECCGSCLICWGSSGLGPWQHQEMRAALERRIKERGYRVIPVLLPACRPPENMPAFLRNLKWVDFRQGLGNPGEFNYLVKAIRITSAVQKNAEA